MTFGIETYRANGSTAMTGANKPGIFYEVLTVQATDGASGNKVYTQIPSGALYTYLVSSNGARYTFTIGNDGSGHAKISWSPDPSWVNAGFSMSGTDTYKFLVFAKRINQTDSYGILIYNDDGDQLTDFNYPVPQYLTTLQPSATPVFNSYCNGNNIVARHDHTVTLNVGNTRNRFVVVNIPDSTSADIWYSCSSFVPAGASNVTLTLTIVRPRGTTYVVPTLHVFALDGPINGGGSYGTQYFKPDGTLVYDSSAENVSISTIQNINYPTSGNNSYAITLPSSPGLALPFFEIDAWYYYPSPDINGNTGYTSTVRGLIQRKGSTIYTKQYEIREDPNMNPPVSQLVYAGLDNNFTIAVDISQLSPGSVTGTPPTAFQ